MTPRMNSEIDVPSRRAAAEAVRRYVSGRICNDDMDDALCGLESSDDGVEAVRRSVWTLYCDIDTHFADGDHAIVGELRRKVARWVLFLHSDTPYSWPEFMDILDRRRGVFSRLRDVLTLGRSAREHARRVARFLGHGDLDYWPFKDQAELRAARLHVRLLSGANDVARRDAAAD